MYYDLNEITPVDLGLPEEFAEFRKEQVEAIELAANSNKRFVGLGLPTGSGKSLVGMGLARVLGVRTGILTGTKGLEDQYEREFGGHGLVDIRGKANYRCADYSNLSCRFGPHEGCRLAKGLGCTYESERYKAKQSDIVSTNYAYWIRANQFRAGLELTEVQGGPNPFGLLVLDEAHNAPELLASAIKATLREQKIRDLKFNCPKEEGTINSWAAWAIDTLPKAGAELDEQKEKILRSDGSARASFRNKIYELEELIESLVKIAAMLEEEWVVEMRMGTHYGRVWEFDCVWPGRSAESNLFRGIPRVLLMSGSLKPITFRHLGIKVGDYEFKEWDRVFPANHAPIYYWPSKTRSIDGERGKTIKLNRDTTEEDWAELIEDCDKFIDQVPERKGIIHTGSYERQKLVVRLSRHKERMYINTNDPDSESASEVANRFMDDQNGGILVSPSFSTGWNFSGRKAEWMIVLKLPYPAIHTKVMRAREAKDKLYIPNLVVQDLIQSTGRANRFFKDRCVTIIKDGNLPWFMKQHKERLAPNWWDFLWTYEIPKPGPRAPENE